MQGLALTTEQIIEILSAYSAPTRQIDAVGETPGWSVLGAFTMPVTEEIQLKAIGSVSSAELILHVRLYCITPGFVGPVAGSAITITSTTDVEQESGLFELTGSRIYQYQAEVVGGLGDDKFGVVESAWSQGGGS